MVIATTRDAKVTDPFYFSSGIATGSVDIVRSLGGAGDIVTGYASYPQSLAVRLAGLSGISSSGEGYFLYEPKMQGVSILCLSDRPPATCPPPSWYRDRYAVIATSAIAMNDMFPTAYGWAYG